MTIRRFCDQCLTELPIRDHRLDDNGRLAARTPNGIMFEIITGWNGIWNAGDLCVSCIVSTVRAAGTRPNAVGAEELCEAPPAYTSRWNRASRTGTA